MSDDVLCFPEPRPDPTWGHRGESMAQWLRRSTIYLAAETRRFLNEQLVALPPEASRRLCDRLHADRSQSTLFELMVGRLLQTSGALELEHEVVDSTGRNVDWGATFADGYVSIESVAPVINAFEGQIVAARNPMFDMIERLVPADWRVWVQHVPNLGPNESKAPLRRTVQRFVIDHLPASPAVGRRVLFSEQMAGGELRLMFWYQAESTTRTIAAEAPIVGYDDSAARIDAAIEGKKTQVRHARRPVLVAVLGGFTTDLEQFDIGVFGRTVGAGFDPTGVFGRSRSRDGDPVIAGVLAFPRLTPVGAADPVLYLHPDARLPLPSRLVELEHRTLTPGGIETDRAARSNAWAGVNWARPEESGLESQPSRVQVWAGGGVGLAVEDVIPEVGDLVVPVARRLGVGRRITRRQRP